MAAHRKDYKTVLFPAANEKDVEDIPKEVRQGITLKAVKSYDEIFEIAIGEAVPGKAAPRAPKAAAPSAWARRGPITVTLEPQADRRDPMVVLTGPSGVIDRYPLHEAREVLRQATRRWWKPWTWTPQNVDPGTMNPDEQRRAVTAYAEMLAARSRKGLR